MKLKITSRGITLQKIDPSQMYWISMERYSLSVNYFCRKTMQNIVANGGKIISVDSDKTMKKIVWQEKNGFVYSMSVTKYKNSTV